MHTQSRMQHPEGVWYVWASVGTKGSQRRGFLTRCGSLADWTIGLSSVLAQQLLR